MQSEREDSPAQLRHADDGLFQSPSYHTPLSAFLPPQCDAPEQET
jgi:hypothetical protein